MYIFCAIGYFHIILFIYYFFQNIHYIYFNKYIVITDNTHNKGAIKLHTKYPVSYYTAMSIQDNIILQHKCQSLNGYQVNKKIYIVKYP